MSAMTVIGWLVATVLTARLWYARYSWGLSKHRRYIGDGRFEYVWAPDCGAPTRAICSLFMGLLWPFVLIGWLVVGGNTTSHERHVALVEREQRVAALERELGVER